MLIRLHIENFLSFKNETEFSMIAGRSTQHPEHVIGSKDDWSPSVLRTAAIYGKNASGKSNFIKAIEFAKELIISSASISSSLPIRPFRLESGYLKKPSGFRFELKINNRLYDYGFRIDNKIVHEEWLYEVKRTTEDLLFHRIKNNFKLGKIDYSLALEESRPSQNSLNRQQQRLLFVAEDTRENQLFLTASIERNQPYFKHIYDWFDNYLYVIRPDYKYLDTEFQIIEGDKNENFIKDFEEILKQLDTGIQGIELVEVDIEREIIKAYPFLSGLNEELEKLEPGAKIMLPLPDDRRFALMKSKDGLLNGYKLMTRHKKLRRASEELFNSEEYDLFEINWESRGTQRLMDLIPTLLVMKNSSCTFFIDEIARSLHPELSYKMVKLILENRNLFQSQLIFSTHEDYLMNFNLLRRDEYWFAEKSEFGESTLYSLEEFKPRYDKDIRKGYFNGRFGAIPSINEGRINEVLSK